MPFPALRIRAAVVAVVILVVVAAVGAFTRLPASVIDDLEDQVADSIEDDLFDPLERRMETDLLESIDVELDDAIDAAGRIVPILPRARARFVGASDDDGQEVERGVWVILVAPERIEAIRHFGFRILELRPLESLNRVLLRVEASGDRDLERAVLELALQAPGARIDANHIYRSEAGKVGARNSAKQPATAPTPRPATGLAVGMIDSAVAAKHEALRGADVVQQDFVPYDQPRPTRHGTAVASILVGKSGARLFAASVFFSDDARTSGATTASLVQALDWLGASGVRVINMSLAGPANAVLADAIEQLAAHGTVIVAAVGNGGPAGRPLYPAAYAAVIGVTAVDRDSRVYRYANRGPQVTFAAPGVDVQVARERGYGTATGTSIAAPHATAILAHLLADSPEGPQSAVSRLRARVIDLGDAGYDETYGFGLVPAAE